MDLRRAIIYSRNLPAQQIEVLWEKNYKNNVKIETITDILAFYLHHKVYPPPVQKMFDTLLIAITDPKASKKLKSVLFQTVEEMCLWLSPSCVIDTVKLSTSPAVIAELLPCFMINHDISLPEPVVYERLISAISNPGLSQEDRTKILGFLMDTLPFEMHPLLNKQLVMWLSYTRTSQSSLVRPDDITEVGVCTVLSSVSTVTDFHQLSLVTFSNIRQYLYFSHGSVDESLINATLKYCSALLVQVIKKPKTPHDGLLIPAVLEEVLMILKVVNKVDNSSRGRCQMMVINIQRLADQLRLTGLLLSVWKYQLQDSEESSLSQKILTSVIKTEFSQGVVSHKIALVAMQHGTALAPIMAQYAPNLLKLVATHPSTLVEEFVDIVPHLTINQELIVELMHALLDLPVMSASICISQSGLLMQAGYKGSLLQAVKQIVDVGHKVVYSHLMRVQSKAGQTDELLTLYPSYWSALLPILSLGLVDVCSQMTPLLLKVFLECISCSPKANRLVFPALLVRAPLLCPLPAFQNAILEIISKYVSNIGSTQSELLECPNVIQFLSVISHTQLCPQLFGSVVSALGDHIKGDSFVIPYFETLDALLREMLLGKSTFDLSLETTICTALAKLASRNHDLIPKAIGAFEKLCQFLEKGKEKSTEKEATLQNAKELIRILKNPRLSSVMLLPSSREDMAITALMKVLFQFLK